LTERRQECEEDRNSALHGKKTKLGSLKDRSNSQVIKNATGVIEIRISSSSLIGSENRQMNSKIETIKTCQTHE
jgi:hypothetical protein